MSEKSSPTEKMIMDGRKSGIMSHTFSSLSDFADDSKALTAFYNMFASSESLEEKRLIFLRCNT
jgi:hypothetical protein